MEETVSHAQTTPELKTTTKCAPPILAQLVKSSLSLVFVLVAHQTQPQILVKDNVSDPDQYVEIENIFHKIKANALLAKITPELKIITNSVLQITATQTKLLLSKDNAEHAQSVHHQMPVE